MAAPLPPVPNLGDLAQSGQDPGAPWLVELAPDGTREAYTYGDLERLSTALGRGLRARGLVPGARVGLLAENSARYLIAYFGMMRAGLVAVPINHRLPAETVAYIHEDAGIALTLADATHAGKAPEDAPVLRLDAEDWDALLDPGPLETVVHGTEAVANILYTSGSTGMPKGMPLTHHGYGYSVMASLAGMGRMPEARILISAPLYHMNGLFMSKLTVAAGATQVLLSKFDARAYLQAAAEERCTILTGIPTMIALALRERDLVERLDFDHVASFLIGSSPVTPDLVAQIGRVFRNARVTVTYGTTESGRAVGGRRHPLGPQPGGDDGLPQPPREDGRSAEGRLVRHRRRDAPGRGRVLFLRGPRRRHVRDLGRERPSRRRGGDARPPPGHRGGLRGPDARRGQGHAARGLRRGARGQRADGRRGQGLRAGARSLLRASPGRGIPRPPALAGHQQGRPQDAEGARGGVSTRPFGTMRTTA
jgi:acyl-CoA synthetase (AMP-forming)/AMP-acid ligase II